MLANALFSHRFRLALRAIKMKTFYPQNRKFEYTFIGFDFSAWFETFFHRHLNQINWDWCRRYSPKTEVVREGKNEWKKRRQNQMVKDENLASTMLRLNGDDEKYNYLWLHLNTIAEDSDHRSLWQILRMYGRRVSLVYQMLSWQWDRGK